MREQVNAATMGSAERRLVAWLFVLVTAASLVVQEGAVTGYDGQTMYEVTRSMVERGTFAIDEEFNTLPGPDGREYSRYGLGLSLVAAIPYVASRQLTFSSRHSNHILEAAVSSVMAFITATLIVALYLLARRLGAELGAALLVAVGAVAGTFVLPYSKEFFSEPLTALCLVVTIERLVAGRSAAAGLAVGAAVLVRPQTLLFTPIVMLVAWFQNGFRASLRTGAGAAVGILATFAYNVARFGHPLRFGYEDVGFTTPLLTGMGGLLFEPTKSLLVFAPITVLLPFALWRLWHCNRAAFVLLASNFGIAFVAIAMWFAWHGGWCWGPRLMIPGLVPAIAAIGPWLVGGRRRRTTTMLFSLRDLATCPDRSNASATAEPAPSAGGGASRGPLPADAAAGQPFSLAPASARSTDSALFPGASLQGFGGRPQLPALSELVAARSHASPAAHRARGQHDHYPATALRRAGQRRPDARGQSRHTSRQWRIDRGEDPHLRKAAVQRA
jgi:hypothetical protein